MKIFTALCIVLVIAVDYSNCGQYDGYKLYQVLFKRGQEESLQQIFDRFPTLDVWQFSRARGTADVLTSPDIEKPLLRALKKDRFAVSLLNGDIQGLIDSNA